MLAGVGVFAAGVIGNPLFGNTREEQIDRQLRARLPALHTRIVGDETRSAFGTYRAIDATMGKSLPEAEKDTAKTIRSDAKRSALRTAKCLPVVMPAVHLAPLGCARSCDGDHAVVLDGQSAH